MIIYLVAMRTCLGFCLTVVVFGSFFSGKADAETRGKACSRPLGSGSRSDAFSVAELFLQGKLDRLQGAEILSAAHFALEGTGSAYGYPVQHLLNTLPASAVEDAAAGRVSKDTRELFHAVGYVGIDSSLVELIRRYRMFVLKFMVSRTMALSGWKPAVDSDQFAARLFESSDSITSYSYALASEYKLPPKIVLRAISLVTCGH